MTGYAGMRLLWGLRCCRLTVDVRLAALGKRDRRLSPFVASTGARKAF